MGSVSSGGLLTRLPGQGLQLGGAPHTCPWSQDQLENVNRCGQTHTCVYTKTHTPTHGVCTVISPRGLPSVSQTLCLWNVALMPEEWPASLNLHALLGRRVQPRRLGLAGKTSERWAGHWRVARAFPEETHVVKGSRFGSPSKLISPAGVSVSVCISPTCYMRSGTWLVCVCMCRPNRGRTPPSLPPCSFTCSYRLMIKDVYNLRSSQPKTLGCLPLDSCIHFPFTRLPAAIHPSLLKPVSLCQSAAQSLPVRVSFTWLCSRNERWVKGTSWVLSSEGSAIFLLAVQINGWNSWSWTDRHILNELKVVLSNAVDEI